MRPLQRGFLLAIGLSLAFAGFSAVSLLPAGAHTVVNPQLYTRGISPAQVAAIAPHFGALRGIKTRDLVARFTAMARDQESSTAGHQENGTTITTTNWVINPEGTQTNLGDFPVHSVLSPDGKRMLVVNSGAGVQSIQVVDTSNSSVLQTIPYYSPASVFIGAVYSPDGTSAYVSGGGQNVIHTFSVASDGTLTATGDISLPALPSNSLSTSQYPAGLSISGNGKTLYVADSNTAANTVEEIDAATKKITSTIPVGNTPYGTIVDPRTGMVYVSNWGAATLSLIDPASNTVMATIPVGRHPTDMAFGPYGLLYVSDSDDDAVSVVSTLTNKEIRRLSVTGGVRAPFSSSPQGLTFSPNRQQLYVANAGNNAIAVFTVDPNGTAEYFQGWIPTAWYPTSVQVTPDGATLLVTNGLGMGEGPNNSGYYPNPTRTSEPGLIVDVNGFGGTYCACSFDQFSGSMDIGTLSTIPVPNHGRLVGDTLAVFRNDRYLDMSPTDRSPGNPVPVAGASSPIKHVIYIIKENRTYDQVFGDEKPGNGDPSLALFPRSVTPNLHALADRFGVVDNFYADAQVSADGHNWILSANANDYTEKFWPQDYSASPGRNFGYPFESGTSLPQSPGGFLWDDAAAHNLSYRTYGEYTNFCCTSLANGKIQPESADCAGPATHVYFGLNIPTGDVACFPPTTVNPDTAPNLVGHIDPRSPPYDTNFPDVERVYNWKKDFDQYVANGGLPALELIRLSQDHTKGTVPGQWTPQTMVSDNDEAVGQLVDAVSHSPYWSSTAIFVTEDDAQNGPDHVDSHRTEALVISPYTSSSTARAVSVHYDTAGMVRTIELLLGMTPMSQYDATANPMWELFSSTPDTAPYTAQPLGVPPTLTSPHAYAAHLSSTFDYRLPDHAPAYIMNRILWHAIKGAHTPYPNLPAFRPTPATPRTFLLGSLGNKALKADMATLFGPQRSPAASGASAAHTHH